MAERAEELVRLVVGLYGEGLARLAHQLDPEVLASIAADPLVGSLLLLHGLHPDDTDTRVRRALQRLARESGVVVEQAYVDPTGVVLVTLGESRGCPATGLALLDLVENAVLEAAPEVTGVRLESTPTTKAQPVTIRPRART